MGQASNHDDTTRDQVRVPSPSEVNRDIISHPDNGESDDRDRARLAAEAMTPKHQNPRTIVPEANDTFEKWTGRYLAALEGSKTFAEMMEWDNLNDQPLGMISNKSPAHYIRIMNRFEELKAILQRGSISSGVPSAQKSAQVTSDCPTGMPDPVKEPDAFLKWADGQMIVIDNADHLVSVFESMDAHTDGMFPSDLDEFHGLMKKHNKRLGAD